MIPDETLRLLRTLYRGQCEGYLTLTAIHPRKRTRSPSRHLHIRDKDAIHQSLADLLCANEKGWGAYFSVGLRSQPLGRWKRGGTSDLLTLTALYADLDGELAESFARIRKAGLAGMPGPTAMIGSGRGLHLWWRIQPTDDFAKAQHILTGLAQTLGGDRVTIAQAMRLPGSRNTKPGVDRPCKLLWLAEDRHYCLDDFAKFEARPKPTPVYKQTRAPPCGRINPALVEAIAQTLLQDYGGFVQRNGWIGALCPCGHSHDKPGQHFGFSPNKCLGHCFGRHGRLLIHDLCSHLNLNPDHYGGLYR